jgi:hypothetical protein
MCRRSCCDKSGGQGLGIAAVAIIMGAAFIAARIGPAVARVVHIALEVIRVVALTTGIVVVFAVLAGAVMTITRWQSRRHAALAPSWVQRVDSSDQEHVEPADHRPACLACGGSGTVLRAISGSRYQPSECPVCEPARRVG